MKPPTTTVKDWTVRMGDKSAAPAQAQHSPLPWHIESSASHMTWLCSGNKHIATIMDRDVKIDEDARIQDENASLIVRACNNAQRLADQLKGFCDLFCMNENIDVIRQVRSAEKALAEWSKQK